MGLRLDTVEECRREVKRTVSIPGRFRLTAVLYLEDGSQRIYRAKSINREVAISEILSFIEGVEDATGQKIIWRLRGENTYHMGISSFQKRTIKNRSVFEKILDYFFCD